MNGPVSVTIAPQAASPSPDPCAAAEAHWKAADGIGSVTAYEDHLAKFPTCAFANLAKTKIDELKQKTSLASPSDGMARTSARNKEFDGKWDVTVKCMNASGALAYSRSLVATVADGVLHAEDPTPGRPLLVIEGDIGLNGKATLNARGETGDSAYSVGGVKRGTPYAYTIDAQFERTRGTGKRNELRPCELTFARR